MKLCERSRSNTTSSTRYRLESMIEVSKQSILFATHERLPVSISTILPRLSCGNTQSSLCQSIPRLFWYRYSAASSKLTWTLAHINQEQDTESSTLAGPRYFLKECLPAETMGSSRATVYLILHHVYINDLDLSPDVHYLIATMCSSVLNQFLT